MKSPRGNVWYNWPGPGCQANQQLAPEQFSQQAPYDVAILGAGVVGCALAYELSQYRLRVVMIDKFFDVGEGTSKGNSAIVHTGFDATPGSLESQLVTSASHQWPELARRLKIPYQTVSALMLALNEQQLQQLPKLREKALANGVEDIELVSADNVKQMEPHVDSGVLGGLLVPRESIVDPFTTSIAYAEIALANGVDQVFGLKIEQVDDPSAAIKFVVGENGVRIPTRNVINACGLGSRTLVKAYDGAPMDINPRRGQFLVFDRDCSHLVQRILLPIPTEKTKGMLVTPTIFGNLLAGPTAEDLPPESADATETTSAGLDAVRESTIRMCPALADRQVIATYAGLRCNCAQGSYWMRFNDGHPGMVTLAGIRSTGLTTSISTAQYVVEQMKQQCGLQLEQDPGASDCRAESKWPGWWRRPYGEREKVDQRPAYGRIVCSCENISCGEIQDALEASSGVATLDGLKRRTRVLTGRCQGFQCCVPVAQMISKHYTIPLGSVTKRGPGSEFIASGVTVPGRIENATAQQEVKWKSHYRVVIVGAGPAGMGTAVELGRRGIRDVLLVDRAAEMGGIPAKYEIKSGGVPTFVVWSRGRVLFGQQFVEMLRREVDDARPDIWLECQVTHVDQADRSLTVVSPQMGQTKIQADAIVFACGSREKSRSERGWITGNRPARQLFTMQLLQLLDTCQVTPLQRPVIVGSDLIAFSAAAKLRAAGSQEAIMFDRRARPAAGLLERLYFRRWCRPAWQPVTDGVHIGNPWVVTDVQVANDLQTCDGVILSGELVPNSELVVAAGLAVSQSDRTPVRHSRNELSQPGWYVAGAEAGGFHGAHWCYQDGRRTAGAVADYLARV
ncbi:MAG: FAD-dependent oxidoreductase [Bythopirellula sp.]